ncbi:hypothetical protein GCM10011614_23870 [Novosphingobium colocasiae]|uniref:Uncharacterized protein n=1 Tax=Novosphingobium colocasiae TaxID=1256513 RepID=A0A918UHD3_9SPHN|nr:hypothetical protein GCM10011614_23870 [Novosphingobium colocasiae]
MSSKTTDCIIVFDPTSPKKITINAVYPRQCCPLSARTFEGIEVGFTSLAGDCAAAAFIQAGEQTGGRKPFADKNADGHIRIFDNTRFPDGKNNIVGDGHWKRLISERNGTAGNS